MIERFYSFEKVAERADCLEIAGLLGLSPVKGRDFFNIPWRPGSDSGALHVLKNGWKDFVTGEHGGVIDFVARVKFAGDMQEAQQFLGDYYKLPVDMVLRTDFKTRADHLTEDGYKRVKSYEYRHKDGRLLHLVERWEHPEKKKEFVQRDANGKCSVKDVDTVLYRWPEWHEKSGVCVTEGEKDADTLFELKIQATTNASGAGSWKDSYTEALAGKDIIICEDNDEAGQERVSFLLWELRDVAKSIRVVRFDGESKGFDVTDYCEKYGKKALVDHIKKSRIWAKAEITKPEDDYLAVQEAKRLNKTDFYNYIEQKTEDGEKKTKPRQAVELAEEFFKRFLGFPCKIGETLFDHDRDNKKIEKIYDPNSLFAWMMIKSKRNIHFKAGTGFIPKNEFFEVVSRMARRFEEICDAPVYPNRKDVYFSHPPLPKPEQDCKHLHHLIDFFTPASSYFKVMLYAFFAAPLYYEPGKPRPCWIIDSEDGAGVGKTTLAELIAYLYCSNIIKANANELSQKIDEVNKRLISASGRSSRIFLLDNVTGTFHCPAFADMVTACSISGRPAYGRGEESRPNNLTYIITANSATIDNDTAQRAYFIYLKRGLYSANWLEQVQNYISTYRYNILAEILYTITNHRPFDMPPQTRFPEFETKILQAFCGDEDVYNQVIKTLNDSREVANVEMDMAERIEDEFKRGLLHSGFPVDGKYFIFNDIAEKWIAKALPQGMNPGSHVGYVRNLAKQGFTRHISNKTSRPYKVKNRGLYWNDISEKSLRIIGKIANDKIGEIIK